MMAMVGTTRLPPRGAAAAIFGILGREADPHAVPAPLACMSPDALCSSRQVLRLILRRFVSETLRGHFSPAVTLRTNDAADPTARNFADAVAKHLWTR